jgi:PAS domain S-box-containing protein
MANLVRGHDWSSTSLGPIESWSKELLTIVNLTLCSPSPARTMWGPDFILIYNDAYRPIPGRRHPEALGKSARDVYREAWHVVGPLLESAFKTGQTFFYEKLVVPLQTDKGVQDFYLNYSFNPIYEDGKIAGLFGPLHDVTGEVIASRNLRESEARVSRILQSIGDAVIVTDSEARVTHMNPVAEALTGWSIDEAMGGPLREVFDIVDETTRQAVESPVAKVKRLGTITGLSNHTVLIRKDGTATPIDDSGAPIRDDEGRLIGMVLVFRDISERRAAERERDTLAKQLQRVLDATTDGVLSVDRNWRMTYLNRRAQEFLEPSGARLGMDFWHAFPGSVDEGSGSVYEGSLYVEHYHRAMNDRIAGRFEAYYPEPLNAWFAVLAQPSEDGIILFFRDVTQQRREAQALRESEARYSAIYSASLEYIGLLTPDGTIIDCNRASLEFAGNTREEVVGMNFADSPWFANTPGAPDLLRQAIARAAAGEFIRHEVPLIRPSGETITFDFSLAPVRDAQGEVVFLVPEGRDINELKRTEAALLKSEKLAAVGRLAASIAHEINNPLESVMNLIYLARQHAIDPEARKFLDTADQEIRRVSIIANQTLRFHKQPSNPQAVSCRDLYSTVLSIYEGRLKNSNIEVEMRLRTEHPVVCFEGDIRQVLNNLVSNAIDAMPSGGRLLVRGRQGTSWSTGRKGIVLTVADTGEGMSPQVLKDIFDAFFTTKGIQGTGLGLWVSQEIVTRHNGALNVRSSQRQGRSGTVFALFLPFVAECR